ncbi:MAG: tRNA (pseudouridine(54)-N(1))-methyltransferase TrmY [Candidatus Nanoarchaeia archaeon]|nr:tRNA (pseudouridine(54)-N(1))-methyltransferase TrmY [Candidatus Nanoarchaeia archaeon]
MREFIYYSTKGRTSGNFDDLMQAGRLDIVCHMVINAFYLSHDIRKDVKLHLILNGPPDPPKHIEFEYDENLPISKKDVAGLIKRILYKYKKGIKNNPYPGCFVEKKGFTKVVEELKDRNIYLLDKKGEDIDKIEIKENPVFIIGDEDGIPTKEKKDLIKNKKVIPINIGPQVYFASHVAVILNNQLDRKGL